MKVVGWHSGRQSACNAGDTRDMSFIPELQSFQGEGNGNPLHYLPGKFHGQGRLAGYSPWGHKESDMTECAHTHTHTSALKPPKKKMKIQKQCKSLNMPVGTWPIGSHFKFTLLVSEVIGRASAFLQEAEVLAEGVVCPPLGNGWLSSLHCRTRSAGLCHVDHHNSCSLFSAYWVPSTVPSLLNELCFQVFPKPWETNKINPILQNREPKLGEGKRLVQGHTGSKW